jgi:hypothetical protein
MGREFKKVDLHIHTPESEDYGGNKKDPKEYLRILRAAKSERLSIIAITDHNSIEGYRKIKDLELALSAERNRLLAASPSQATERLSSIEKDLSLFQNILILPGVELEVRYGIHILVIFNNTTPIDVIHKFICDAGYEPADFGKTVSSALQAWDIFSLYNESKKYDCLVIDAHTDSYKGIWRTLRGRGQSRINALKSPQLVAVCYKSETQRNNIQSLLDNVREYKRDIPLAFVKFSDAHEPREIGSFKTWIRFDKADFESLKQAFYNPSENIATEEPSLAKILNALITSKTSFGIPDMTASNMSYFCKMACALNNTNGGHLLFGVSLDKKKVGLSAGKKDKQKIINEIRSSIEQVEQKLSGEIIIYPLQRDRTIVSVRISPSPDLVNLKNDGHIYSITNGKLSILSASEVQRLIETRVTEDIGGKITKRLIFLERECRSTQYLVTSIPVIRKFEDNSYMANFELSVENGIDLDPRKIAQLNEISKSNGVSRGNLFFAREAIQPPRLEDTYLRYTVPVFSVPDLKLSSKTMKTIYVTRGGAAYYSPKDLPVFTQKPPILKLHQSQRNTPYGLSFTICFLKSSFLIWYCKTKFDSMDIYPPKVFKNLRLPVIDTKNANCIELLHKLKLHFEEILKLEKEYLLKYRKFLGNSEKIIDYTNSHNVLVDDQAYNIDLIIYQLLHLTPDEIHTVEDYLILNSIYLPTPRPSIIMSSQASNPTISLS